MVSVVAVPLLPRNLHVEILHWVEAMPGVKLSLGVITTCGTVLHLCSSACFMLRHCSTVSLHIAHFHRSGIHERCVLLCSAALHVFTSVPSVEG